MEQILEIKILAVKRAKNSKYGNPNWTICFHVIGDPKERNHILNTGNDCADNYSICTGSAGLRHRAWIKYNGRKKESEIVAIYCLEK